MLTSYLKLNNKREVDLNSKTFEFKNLFIE